jgi:hypothetical protein
MLLQGMAGFNALVERRIEEAMARGEFDDLPGAGKPLALDDDPLVPEELRVAYRILKNAGAVPAELEEICEVNQLLAALGRSERGSELDDAGAAQAGRRLRALLYRLEASGRSATAQRAWHEYEESLAKRFNR